MVNEQNIETSSTFTINDSSTEKTGEICYGSAENGGVIYSPYVYLTININGGTFSNNYANYAGGVIYTNGNVNISNATFSKNKVTAGSDESYDGGGAI